MEIPFLNSVANVWRRLLGSHPGWIAFALLGFMFTLGLTSLQNDSATFDEVAHIAAGYSYVRYGDFRLNPEHPPLIKDLAGLTLQFLDLRFPTHEASWATEMNGQWETGRRFLYTIGNDANRILFWARLPVLSFAVAFGAFLYQSCRQRWNAQIGLLVLFFYALSPNFLAHARYVTTDVGASAFLFLVLVAFVRFIERPRPLSLCLLSLALTGALLVKFSVFAIYPFLAGVALLVIAVWPTPVGLYNRAKVYGGGLLVASALSLGLMWLFYYPHTMFMPLSVQDRLIFGTMIPGRLEPLARRLLVLNKLPLMEPLVQYLMGLTMVMARMKIGTWTYFNGEVIRGSFRAFFPELFLVKTQVAFLILGLGSIGAFIRRSRQPRLARPYPIFVGHLREHLFLWVMGSFSIFYFAIAVAGNLNLGIRHLLPIYVPLFVLVGVGVFELSQQLSSIPSRPWRIAGLCLMAALLVWYGGSTILTHPSYTAYFNELIGGPSHADRYFSDSSVDWGQDLRRLKDYATEHPEIKRLAIDYFGGGDVKYYFCSLLTSPARESFDSDLNYDCRGSVYDDNWRPSDGPYQGQYIAVSETTLSGDPLFGNHYAYLRERTPIAKIGYSIHLYKLR